MCLCSTNPLCSIHLVKQRTVALGEQELGNRARSLKFFLLQIFSKTCFASLRGGATNSPDHV